MAKPKDYEAFTFIILMFRKKLPAGGTVTRRIEFQGTHSDTQRSLEEYLSGLSSTLYESTLMSIVAPFDEDSRPLIGSRKVLLMHARNRTIIQRLGYL